MIKLYGPLASSARRSAWMLEEVGIAYEMVSVNMQEREHKSEAFLKLNPNGKVPVLVDGDTVLWESLAINLYLAEKYKPELLGKNVEEKGHIYKWSIWGMLNLGGPLGVLATQKWRQLPEDATTEKARADLKQFLPVLDEALKDKAYLVADAFSVADLNTAAVLSSAAFVNEDLSSYTNITRWKNQLATRPAYLKVNPAS